VGRDSGSPVSKAYDDTFPFTGGTIDKDYPRTTRGYAFEIEAYNRTVVTQDRQEGINAFNEKRKPKYKGQ
jgi:hypothetical protein